MQTKEMLVSRRRWLQTMATIAGLSLLPAALGACGRSTSGAALAGDVTRLAVGCDGDTLAYDQRELTAPAGAQIELTFHNRSARHRHNWVLVNGGEEAANAVYEAAMAAGVKNDFLPQDNDHIVVHTPLLASGKSFTLAFQAPTQAGNYLYLCTFPGHYLAGMKGTLTLT